MKNVQSLLDLPPETIILNGTALRNWLLDQIDVTQSCIDDLELRECVRNEFMRGQLKSFEQVLEKIGG